MQNLLTPEQVAERLQVTVQYVYVLLRTGTLRGYKLGRRSWRVWENDIVEYVNQSLQREETT